MKQHPIPIYNNGAGHAASSRLRRLSVWLIVLQLILAYLWLVSGINKLLDSHFGGELVPLLRASTQGNPYGWYAGFLRVIVLPHHAFFAIAVQVMELGIGVVLLLGAALWIIRPSGRLVVLGALATTAALLGSIGLSLNYFFQAGSAVPWINPGNGLAPGVDTNRLVALVSAVVLGSYVSALLATRGQLAVGSQDEEEVA
jgi:thiosulfate dehydrogenase (quinone) large subunit